VAYCDNETLIEHISEIEIIQLTDDEKTAQGETTVTAAVAANAEIQDRIDRAITNADAIINAFCRKHYAPPIRLDSGSASTVANTPPVLVMISALLAIVKLYTRRHGEFTNFPETVKEMLKTAMDLLKGINKGEIDLGVTPDPGESEVAVATVQDTDQETADERYFTRVNLEDF
jgi:phage gp36-like protein